MTRLRVKYIPTGSSLPEVLEEGMLYFVESQHTILKDGNKPFSGINNISFEPNGTTTRILFSTDGSSSGNAGSIVVGNDQLNELVNEINDKVADIENSIKDIKFKTNSVINLDVVAPSVVPYTLSSAIAYVNSVDNIDIKNIAVLFNDGERTQLYFFKGRSRAQILDESKWEATQIGSGKEVQKYDSIASFPAIGKENTLYIDKSNNDLWFWNETTLSYKQCGFDIDNIRLIDTNF